MKKIVLLCGALLTLTAVAANAQLHIAVDDCGGDPAATWICTSNSNVAGSAFTAVASVTSPAITTLTGEEATVEIAFANPVPDWWKFGAAPMCRLGTAFAVNFTFQGANCVDYFGTVGTGASGGFFITTGPSTDPQGPVDANRLRVRTVSAVDGALALESPQPAVGDEVFLFNIAVNRSRTVGTPSCVGCAEPACLVFKKLILTQPVGVGDYFYETPANFGFITLQGGTLDCPTSTPATKSSWGQVKSLYR